MRVAALLAVAALALAGCGGSTGGADRPGVTLATARARTVDARSAQFKVLITADLAGTKITAEENGTASFTRRRAHLYKQVPGSPVPQELVLVGPYTYTNANIQAALGDPTVRPWTKLDNRRLTAAQRQAHPDELAHVLAPAYLADGVIAPERAGTEKDGTIRFTGRVDPARLARRVPAAASASILTAVRNDYAATPFPATFWLDDQGRVRRVLVDYTTPKGSRITIDTTYSEFGTPVDATLPAEGKIADISP
jgi:hypothetical protein